MVSHKLARVYRELLRSFGPQHWWPGDTRLEIIAGAILTQNTAWTNVEKAIAVLKANGCLSLKALRDIPEKVLARHIRSSGYFRIKAGRLKNFVVFVWKNYNGRLDLMFNTSPEMLREQMMAINGIGPETADSILLYAGNKPAFVMDTYTKRILVRHDWAKEKDSYDDLQGMFVRALPKSARMYNEYHALLVRAGKHFCFKSNPRCSLCPLYPYLPAVRRNAFTIKKALSHPKEIVVI